MTKEDKVKFIVGGKEMVAHDVTLQRLKKMWPAIETAGSSTNRLTLSTSLAQVVGVLTEESPDVLDSTSLEALGLNIERYMLSTELDGLNVQFVKMLKLAGLGGEPGEAQAASSTETGTQ